MKNKKIACFVALPHHTRFLSPVAEAAERLGAKIVFFTTMSDFPFERALVKKGRECKLLQSYGTDTLREKVADTTDAFFKEWVTRCFQWDGMRHWSLILESTLITDGFEEYFCLEEFIKAEKPDMFIALHERNRWGKLIGHLSTKYGVPYVTFQEGDYYEDRISFSGHTEYTTALMLWGNETKDRLERLKSSPEKFVIVGNTHLATVKGTYFRDDEIAKTRQELNIPPGKKVVLFLMGLQWGVINSPDTWEELLKGIGDDVVKIFKWHPKVSYNSYKTNVEELFRNKFPSCIVVQNYDSYRLLPIADYCVTLGKTTLAVEAVSFGKPLFSLPGKDGAPDHYAAWGISQPLWPPGNYDLLYKTIREGVPPAIERKVEGFLNDYFFYKNNVHAIERAVEVIDHIFKSRKIPKKVKEQGPKIREFVPGRLSFIVPSGDDQEALLSTLTALSQNVKAPDWEVVIIINNDEMEGMLSGLSGDVKTVRLKSDSLSGLYNKGAEAATGEFIVFLKPGIVYFKGEGLQKAMGEGIAGIQLKNADMTPYCLGMDFNFNHVPFMIKDEVSHQRSAVGGGLIGMHRKVFDSIGGFDEGIANHLMEADTCLSARDKGYSITYLSECLGFVYKETFVQNTEDSSQQSNEEWKGRIRFFAKWCGKLPKDDDYIKFAGDLLKA